METYRLSSKLREQKSEYLIQTANNASQSEINTMVYVDGALAERVVRPHPQQIDPQEVLSLVKTSHGEKKKEVEMLLSTYASVLEQGEPDTMYHLGTAFFYKGYYREARELLYRAATQSTGHHQAFNGLAMVELLLCRPDDAVAAASQAVALRPRFADYRNNLGEAYLAQRDCQQAIREFTEATQINMYYGEAYYNLAMARIVEAEVDQDQNRWPERLETIHDNLRKAVLIYDGYKRDRFEVGMSYLQEGKLDLALTEFRAVRELVREATRREFSSLQMKFLLFPNWVSEQAIADRIGFLKSELSKNPSYVDLQVELSQCYLEQSKMACEKAIEQYRKTAEINPSLRKVSVALSEAEEIHRHMTNVLSKITEKG